jgi:hypothetical protein
MAVINDDVPASVPIILLHASFWPVYLNSPKCLLGLGVQLPLRVTLNCLNGFHLHDATIEIAYWRSRNLPSTFIHLRTFEKSSIPKNHRNPFEEPTCPRFHLMG